MSTMIAKYPSETLHQLSPSKEIDHPHDDLVQEMVILSINNSVNNHSNSNNNNDSSNNDLVKYVKPPKLHIYMKKVGRIAAAGMTFIENFTDNNGVVKPVLSLFHDKKENNYCEIGGKVDEKESGVWRPDITAAIREVDEEAAKLIRFKDSKHFSSKYNGNIEPYIRTKYGFYHSFVVAFSFDSDTISDSDYQSNRQILETNHENNSFFEMDHISRFYLRDIESAVLNFKRKAIPCPDVNGNICYISSRSSMVFKAAVETGLFNTALRNPIRFRRKVDPNTKLIHLESIGRL